MADETDPIETARTSPKSAESDGTRVEQHSLKDQIAADRYQREKTAQQSGSLGVNFFKMKPGGGW
jgi:hypothetical protein